MVGDTEQWEVWMGGVSVGMSAPALRVLFLLEVGSGLMKDAEAAGGDTLTPDDTLTPPLTFSGITSSSHC